MPDLGDFEFICDNAYTKGKLLWKAFTQSNFEDDFKATEIEILDVLQCNLAFGLSIEHLRRYSTVLTDEIDGIHVRKNIFFSSSRKLFSALPRKVFHRAFFDGLRFVNIQAVDHWRWIDETRSGNSWKQRVGLPSRSLQVRSSFVLFTNFLKVATKQKTSNSSSTCSAKRSTWFTSRSLSTKRAGRNTPAKRYPSILCCLI